MHRTRNLRKYILLRLILAITLAIFIVGLLSFLYLKKKTSESVQTKNELLAKAVAGEVRGFLNEPYAILTQTALFLSSHKHSGHETSDLLDTVVRKSGFFESLFLIDRNGTVFDAGLTVLQSPLREDYIGLDFSARKYFKETLALNIPRWSDTFLSMVTGDVSLTLSIPFHQNLLVANFSIEKLYDLTIRLKAGEHIITSIIGSSGALVFHPDKKRVDQHVNLGNIAPVTNARAGGLGTHEYVYEGTAYIGSITVIPETGWMVLVSQTIDDAYAPVTRLIRVFLFGLAIAIIITASMSVIVSNNLVRPLSQLRGSSRAIAGGKYDTDLPSQQYTEIEDLARSFRDMASAIKKRENQLMKSEERNRILVETMNDGIVVIDRDNKLTYANPRLCRLLGYSDKEILGRNLKDFFDSTNQKILLDQLARRRKGEDEAYEIEWTKQDGNKMFTIMSPVPLYSDGEFRGSFAVITDITERKKLEIQLLHSQKLEAVGQLAGGIAHDFNNILTAMISYSYLLKNKLDEHSPLKDNVDKILSLSDRASQITKGLLTFSRKQYFDFKPISLNDVVRNVINLISKFVGEEIVINTRFSDHEPKIIADWTQVEQILVNLATNARDAMSDGGTLTVATDLVEFDKTFINTHGFGKPGMHAVLTVSDTGTGMNQETRDKIYEPFFTTKEVGKGTGLGLSIIYGIVKEHNGHITVHSEEGKRTTFRIFFPCTTVSPEDARNEKPADFTGNGQYILLAEDEEMVRKSIRTILNDSGYNVIEAVNGKGAVEKYSRSTDTIGLLLLDVVMPGMNGREVYEEIQKVTPDIKVIFMSGYTADVIRRKNIMEEDVMFLSKPISPDVLLLKIRDVLKG